MVQHSRKILASFGHVSGHFLVANRLFDQRAINTIAMLGVFTFSCTIFVRVIMNCEHFATPDAIHRSKNYLQLRMQLSTSCHFNTLRMAQPTCHSIVVKLMQFRQMKKLFRFYGVLFLSCDTVKCECERDDVNYPIN